jgi:cyclopropane-fatty-acyl-phospholipid synthase
MSLDALAPGAAAAAAPRAFRRVLDRLHAGWRDGALVIDLPDRAGAIRLGAGREARLSLHNWRALRRVLLSGDVGFAQGYLAGDWDTPDLAELLGGLARNYEGLAAGLRGPRLSAWVSNALQGLLHGLNRNTRAGSRRNILAHYDLGNAFYELWLDPSMTYSSALFAEAGENLQAAQDRKYARLAELAGVGPGDRVLEVGCGWGGFAEHAALQAGAEVTAITLSPAQQAYAEARLARSGAAASTKVRQQDYRAVEGRFDAVVSIEMFEAVGEAYWPDYFRMLHERLKPGGRAALQVITLREDLFDDYRRRPDFIQLHVFPGGMLPTESRLRAEAARAGLTVAPQSWLAFGQDYARTLALWRERFEAAWPQIAGQGFDERFRRLWRYYLAYCEAGFRTGRTDVVQFALTRA